MCGTLVVLSAAGWLAYRHYMGRVDRVAGLDLSRRSPSGAGGPSHHKGVNYLLVGSDTADGITDAELREIGIQGRSERSGVRTDTVLLVHIPEDGSGATFVSFPRDSLVEIPGHGRNKLNAAYLLGERERKGTGPASLVATIEALSGLQLDHYVQVSLYGFYSLTNAVGGVSVCLKQPARDDDAGVDLPAGRQVLHGKEALGFVRQRHALPGEDLGRIKRQQYYLGALVRRTLTTRTLVDPVRLNRILNALGDNVTVDQGTSGRDLIELARHMRNVATRNVAFTTIPVSNPGARVSLPGQPRASVVLLDTAQLPGFFDHVINGTPQAPPIRPSDVTVTVLNGTTRPGLAAAARDELRPAGFTVQRIGTAAATPRTTVFHAPNDARSAVLVASRLGHPRLAVDASLPTGSVRITLGDDFHDVVRSTTPDKTGPVKFTTAADDGCIA